MNVAQPSSIDPFQETLKLMKGMRGSPAIGSSATPPPGTSNTPPSAASTPTIATIGFAKFGKKKKSVTWAPDGSLEAIRLIEPAVYDDDDDDNAVDVSVLVIFIPQLCLLTPYVIEFSFLLLLVMCDRCCLLGASLFTLLPPRSLAVFRGLFLFLVQQGIHLNLRDLHRGEGAALHSHLFEETIDWFEPLRKQFKRCPFE